MAEKALKTSVFKWEGTDKKGAKVKGELSGKSPPPRQDSCRVS